MPACHHNPNWVNWTPDEVWQVQDYLDQGLPVEVITRRLGKRNAGGNLVAQAAVYRLIQREGLSRRSPDRQTTVDVARLLGRPRGTVGQWLRAGYLSTPDQSAEDQPRGPHRRGERYAITSEAVLQFLANPLHWHRWWPNDISDRALREWSKEIRAAYDRYLTTDDVCQQLHVTWSAVSNWVASGYLSAYGTPSAWRFKPEEVAAFIMPSQWSKRGGSSRRFTPDEDRQLIALLCKRGMTYERAGHVLGRNPRCVTERYRVLRARGEAPARRSFRRSHKSYPRTELPDELLDSDPYREVVVEPPRLVFTGKRFTTILTTEQREQVYAEWLANGCRVTKQMTERWQRTRQGLHRVVNTLHAQRTATGEEEAS